MKLRAGQRFLLASSMEYVRVESGQAEIYLTNRSQGAFRQEFLFTRGPGQAVFPLDLKYYRALGISIYPVTETELTIFPREGLPPEDTAALMNGWFLVLSQLPRIAHMKNLGDDLLHQWAAGAAIQGEAGDYGSLWQQFEENQETFGALSAIEFAKRGEDYRGQALRSERYKKRLADDVVENLLGERDFLHAEGAGEQDDSLEAVFIVRRVASYFSLSAEEVVLPQGITKRMSRTAILYRVLHNTGLAFRRLKLEKGWEKKDCGPMIGYLGPKKELCALLPCGENAYEIITYGKPQGQSVTEETAALLDENAYACYAGFPAKSLRIRDLLKFMFRRAWRKDYRTILAASFLGSLLPLLLPIITETIFSDIIPVNDREVLVTVTQVMMIAGFTTATLSLMRSMAVIRIGIHSDMAAEAALWHRLLSLPVGFFRKFQAGELLSRMRSLEYVKQFMTGQYIGSVLDIVFSVWSLLLMCYYSVKLTIAALIIWAVYLLVTAFIYRPLLYYNRKQTEAANRNSGQVQQIFNALAKFREHGAESQAYYLWSKTFGEEWKWSLKLRQQGNWNSVISAVQPLVLMFFLYYLVMYQLTENVNGVLRPAISSPTFIAFSAAYGMFNAALLSVIPSLAKLLAARPHFENLRPILEAVPEWNEYKADADVLSGQVEVRHLSFSYVPGKRVLDDISFTIPAGASVALVGASGSGKSTLLRLLLGFEMPEQGAIFYDGQDLSGLSITSVRSQMGVVLQEGQLMTGDIFSNIAGVSSLTMEGAWAAARAAGVEEDIRAMPMGMMTMISEGSGNISGGQRQRLLIARAIASRPPIMLFDEATSALDNRAQAIVMDSLSRLQATRIIVAHRLSTVRNVDRILVLDKGSIVERGTFSELMEKNGVFARLVRRQM